MKQNILLLIIILFLSKICFSQPKREFRAVWLATVVNIDWPSKQGLDSKTQKNEIINILDYNKSLGMNAIILQIRPTADAFYQSELEPWSRYLTGTQGKAPNPYYDPLTFWLAECHKRGMELHAWLNPYRVAQNADEELSTNHIAFKHPEWILKYGNKLYFDPGQPGARDFVVNVVKDIVDRYDVDAIHFDDYFYPYPLNEEFPDTASFRQFNRGFTTENIADWRRDNVNTTIKMLNKTIKASKPWVKFGISPFGVWRNKEDDPRGSDTKAGVTNYDHLYADIIKWQKEGWIDYTLPQLYWHIGHPLVDFTLLCNWWKNHTYGRGMYVGQAPYRVDPKSNTKEWTEPDQLPKQVRIVRSIPEIEGSAYFSNKTFYGNLLGFQDSLRNDLYKNQALIPTMPWLDNAPPAGITKLKRSGRKIKWTTVTTKNELNRAWQYVIYLTEKGKEFSPNSGKDIYTITNTNQVKLDRINAKRKKYEVRISVLDRLKNESLISLPVDIKL